MEDATQKYIDFGKAIRYLAPPEFYALHADMLTVCSDLLFPLYEHALAYASGKEGREFAKLSEAPEETVTEFFAKTQIGGPVMTMKGIAAINAGDAGLGMRMFDDAIKCTPEPAAYVEPYFYMLMAGCVFGLEEENRQYLADIILKAQPYIFSRIDYLASRIEADWTELAAAALKKYLPAP
jgi:hypothetical protein